MNPNTNAWNRLRYDLYAPFYDIVVRRLDAGRRQSIQMTGLTTEELVLIPGCGTGLDFDYLPPGVRVIAGDLAPAMVRKAAARAKALGFDADVRVMDAHALDLPDEHVDAVLLHLILAVVPDPVAAIREVARVLKPGGRVGIFDKFLPDGARASLLRRAASLVANAFATDLNRQLGPLLSEAGLVVKRREPALFGGLFEAVIAEKPAHP